MRRVAASALAFTLSLTIPLGAHHSTAMYDNQHPVTVTGSVKRFEWTNPHAHINVDVTDDKGVTREWDVELMSLNHLRSYGWMRNTVKAGDKISCTGSPAKSGDPAMIANTVELPDGSKIRS